MAADEGSRSDLSPDEIRGVLDDVPDGGEFAGSARLQQLLSYLVEEATNDQRS